MKKKNSKNWKIARYSDKEFLSLSGPESHMFKQFQETLKRAWARLRMGSVSLRTERLTIFFARGERQSSLHFTPRTPLRAWRSAQIVADDDASHRSRRSSRADTGERSEAAGETTIPFGASDAPAGSLERSYESFARAQSLADEPATAPARHDVRDEANDAPQRGVDEECDGLSIEDDARRRGSRDTEQPPSASISSALRRVDADIVDPALQALDDIMREIDAARLRRQRHRHDQDHKTEPMPPRDDP